MRNVNVLKVYNLVNSKGNKLKLRLGILRDRVGEVCNADKGYRWSFEGNNIPMPVRSRTWFNGFPEEAMLDWLKGNGWYPHTCVEMCDGSAKVYELPKGDKESDARSWDVDAFHNTIRDLVRNGKRLTAVRVYRYAHRDATLKCADTAVREICGES